MRMLLRNQQNIKTSTYKYIYIYFKRLQVRATYTDLYTHLFLLRSC